MTLHVAQPALSHQIQLLEQELGASLLHRTRQGVLPTDAGKKFYSHAQAILKQVLDAKSSVGQLGTLSGTVALGIPHSVSAPLALPLLKAVHAAFPDITLQLTEALTGNLVEPLKSGQLNLAILFDDGQLNDFVASKLLEEEIMYIFAPSSMYRAVGEAIDFEVALENKLILPGIQHGVRQLLEAEARAAGKSLTQVVEINSVTILKSALLADIGATLVPPAPFFSELYDGSLCAVPVADTRLFRTMTLCSSKTIPLTDSAKAICELVCTLIRHLGEEGHWLGARVCAKPLGASMTKN